MNDLLAQLPAFSKAIAGALAGVLIGLLARYGFNTTEDVNNAIEVIVTALVSAVSGFVVVYFSPKNKEVK